MDKKLCPDEQEDRWLMGKVIVSAMLKHSRNCPDCKKKLNEMILHSASEYEEICRNAEFWSNFPLYASKIIFCKEVKANANKGNWCKDVAKESEAKILSVLTDNKQHRYSELLNLVPLSRATLSKHLKDLEKRNIVTRIIDTKSSIYPYPVYYLLTGTQNGKTI
jgi:DNA-binding transcriptional ArsR family regulator